MSPAPEAKKKQAMRFDDHELSLIKNTFSENDDLMFAVRKVFLQMELDANDMAVIIATFKDKANVMALMWKTFLPTLDPKAPMHQLIDLWMSVDVKGQMIQDLLPTFQARELLIKLLKQQLTELENVAKGLQNKAEIQISDLTKLEGKTAEEFYVNISARNTLVTHIETQLTQLSLLAGLKNETFAETEKRLRKDSNQ